MKTRKIKVPAITDADYREVQAALRLLGFSVRSWALTEEFCPSTVYDAIRGRRSTGPDAVKILEVLEDTLNAK